MNAPRFVNPATVGKDLLSRYATQGPRYTSYPTAPHFFPEVDREALVSRYRQSNAKTGRERDLSLYVHVPFCRRRCAFCGCFTEITHDPAQTDPFLAAVEAELRLALTRIDPSRPLRQLALGGGSPSFLDPARLDRLLSAIVSHFTFTSDAERSIEIDPRAIVPAQLDVLFAHGFNRFSLGVQDFDEEVLEKAGRPQGFELSAALVERLHQAGQRAINFDFIYGLPGQTPESMARTVDRALALGPSRVALYGYAHVPWMRPHQKALERHGIPGPEERLALFGAAFERYVGAGFEPVGMDHFARPDDDLAQAQRARTLHRNFMGYTTHRGLDLLALGPSAISAVGDTYAQNTKDLDFYVGAALSGQAVIERGFILGEEDRMRRELIIDLFCNFALDGEAFGARFGVDFLGHFKDELKRLQPMQDDGLLNVEGARFDVTPLGRVFIRNICMVFDRYLEAESREKRYSQTV